MPSRRLLPALIALVLVACDSPSTTTAPPPSADAAVPASTIPPEAVAKQLNELFAQYFEESLELNPIQSTFLGERRYNDRLPNMLSAEFRDQQKAFEQKWLDRMKSIDANVLAGQDRLSYDMFVNERRENIEGFGFPGHLIPINQFYNLASLFAMLGSGTNAQPFQNVEDYDNWLKRVDKFPAIIDQAIVNMREGMRTGVVQPKVLMEKAIPQIRAHLVDNVETSTFYKPIQAMPETIQGADRERLTSAYRTMISDTIVPAYRKLATFLETEYLPACRDTVGMAALPNGRDWYAYQVKSITTTNLTPERIHEIGQSEVKRILAQMDDVQKRIGFQGSRAEFFAHTNSDPALFYDTEKALLDGYEALRERVGPALPRLFSTLPKAPFEIRAVEPFRAASASAASYQGPSEDGTRPGIFYVNTANLDARPKWAMTALYLHEAEPGHHYQIALQQELPDLPKFRRFGGYTAYTEGWGLYAESLGEELGAYEDPYQYYGRLAAELWRAIRLVSDTGIHALGWTREQTLEFMRANSPEPEERMVAEAERFMAIPGQALAYKIGELKIRELRTRAEQALGDRFDVRAFHAQVLEDGALPLDVLEAKIDRWIAAQKPAA